MLFFPPALTILENTWRKPVCHKAIQGLSLSVPARAAALDSSKDELLQEFKDNGIHILAIKDSLLFSIIRVIFFDYCDIRINTLFIMI